MINLRECLESAVSVCKSARPDSHVPIITDIPPNLPIHCIGDEQRIKQILVNLIGNALKFTREGTITLKAVVKSNELLVSITDTGVGISASDLTKIFHRFQQVDSSLLRKFEGSGLGLSIAKGLSELMGGDLSVTSVVGKGSEFVLKLPLKLPDDVE